MRFIFIIFSITISILTYGQQADTTSKFIEEKSLPNEDKIYESFACEEKASFPGGDVEMIKFIAEHLKYSDEMQEKGIEGTVYLKFVVTKKGEIGEVKVLRSIDPLMEAEAIRVVKSFPKWNPAKINGQPVNSWYVIPIRVCLH